MLSAPTHDRVQVDVQAATRDSDTLHSLERHMTELRERLAADERTEAAARQELTNVGRHILLRCIHLLDSRPLTGRTVVG